MGKLEPRVLTREEMEEICQNPSTRINYMRDAFDHLMGDEDLLKSLFVRLLKAQESSAERLKSKLKQWIGN